MYENLNKLIYFLSCISIYLGLTYSALPAENKIFVQENISAASLTKEGIDNIIRLQFLATDIEEIFQKTMKERIGVDLMRSGALENQIGEMVLKRIILSNKEGQACERNLIKSGEDPSNDELVLIEIKFQCVSDNFIYDPRELLSTHSHRSWQIILVHEGNADKEYFMNSESAPVIITSAINAFNARFYKFLPHRQIVVELCQILSEMRHNSLLYLYNETWDSSPATGF